MSERILIFLIALLSPMVLLAQSSKVVDCGKIREGTFYFYPLKSEEKFTIIRKGSVQMEINAKTSDTSFWKTNWINDCVLNLKFIRSTKPMSDAQKSFLNAHVTVVQVLEVEKGYYAFKGGLDSIGAMNSSTDTLWQKPR
jgi:hypothetical protein